MEWVDGIPDNLQAISSAANSPRTEGAFADLELSDFARLLHSLEDAGWRLVAAE